MLWFWGIELMLVCVCVLGVSLLSCWLLKMIEFEWIGSMFVMDLSVVVFLILLCFINVMILLEWILRLMFCRMCELLMYVLIWESWRRVDIGD